MHLIIAFTATELYGTPQAHFSFAVLGGMYITKHIILYWHNTKLFSCMASTTLRKKNLL